MNMANTANGKLMPTDEMLYKFATFDEIVVFDTETTGLSPDKYAELLEIGAVKISLKTGRPVPGTDGSPKFHRYIKPKNGKVPAKITELTHITTEKVANSDYFEKVLPDFLDWVGDTPLLAHNAQFDKRFITFYGLMVGRVVNNDILCSMKIDQALNPQRSNHKIATIFEEECQEEQREAHSAYADAWHTAKAVLKLREQIDKMGVNERTDVFNPIPKEYVDPDSIRVGVIRPYKYKDKRIGNAYFISTSVGAFYYNITRDVWGMQRLIVDMNVDVGEAKDYILAKLGTNEQELTENFPA